MAVEAKDILAGPVVRRVTTDSVAIWAVLAVPARIVLQIWRDPEGSAGRPLVGMLETNTRQVGERLFFVLAKISLVQGAQLEPGRVYAYDLLFDGRSLGDLGLLQDGQIDGHRHVALGYVPGLLPTFVVAPLTVPELAIAHGSCRRPYAAGKDGLVALDQIIERARVPSPSNPRPHYMFHTGDQIYADDPSPEMLEWMSAAAVEHIGRNSANQPIERVRVDLDAIGQTVEFPVDTLHFPAGRRQRLVVRAAGMTSGDGDSHLIGFGECVFHYLFSWCNVLWPHLENDDPPEMAAGQQGWKQLHKDRAANVTDFIEAWIRQYDEAKFFVGEGRAVPSSLDARVKHVEAWRLLPKRSRALDQMRARAQDGSASAAEVAEWAADRDSGWNQFWEGIANAPPVPQPAAEIGSTSEIERSLLIGSDAELTALAELLTPTWYAGAHHFNLDLDPKLERDPLPASSGETRLRGDAVLWRLRRLRHFYEGLPFARRALANVSSMMMFDDHEVTDDWNANRDWVKGVRERALGRDMISNGLLAYALCQDWGNAPERYEAGQSDGPLLIAAQTMFRQTPGGPRREIGPDLSLNGARRQLERAFMLDENGDILLRARWDWRIAPSDVAPYEILSINNRTERGFETSDSPPANLTDEAMQEEIPEQGPSGAVISLVITPLPPLGFPPLEQIGQPFLNMQEDYQKNARRPGVLARLAYPEIERDYNFGRLIRDPEPWGFHPRALEAFFRRLSSRRCVIFLSGDVHYSLTAKMTYWKGVAATLTDRAHLEPSTRFIQLTSSALQNQTGEHEILISHIALAQQLGSVISGPFDRLGWSRAGVDAPSLPSAEQLSSVVRRALQVEPVIIPVRALPQDVVASLRSGTLPKAPEWAWRMEQVKDLRPDEDRYAALDARSHEWRLLDEGEFATDTTSARRIADHHEWHARFGNPRRFLIYSNVGLLSFEPIGETDELEAVHTLYCWDRGGYGPGGGPAAETGPWPTARLAAQPYTQHRVALDPADELAPDRVAP